CGTPRDAAGLPATDDTDAAPAGVSPAAIWLAAIVVVAGGGVWLWSTAPAAPAHQVTSGAPDTLPGGEPSTAGPATPGPEPAVRPSLEWPVTPESMAADSAPASVTPPPPAPAPAPAAYHAGSLGVEDLVARAGGAVVMVEAGNSRGTGFFVRDD